MNARRVLAALSVLLGLAACGGGSESAEIAPIAPGPAATFAGPTASATALPPFAGPKTELSRLFKRMRAAHAIQVGVRATGRNAEETTTEIFFDPVAWRERGGDGDDVRDTIFIDGRLFENLAVHCPKAPSDGGSGWLLIKHPGDGVGSDPIVAQLAPVFLPKPLRWLQRTVFAARTATPAGYTLVGRVGSDSEHGVRYVAFITMHLNRAGLPTEYSLNFTARGLTADTYAVTFRYDDVPEIPPIAHSRPDKPGGLDPCAASPTGRDASR